MSGELLIDISAAVNQGAGIGRFARELTERLIPILDASSTRLWYAEDDRPADPDLPSRPPWSGLSVKRAPLSRLNVDRIFVRQNLPFDRILRLGRPSDVYSPDFTSPEPDQARTHITVHDLAWLHPEAETPEPLTNFLAPVVERSVRSAATVFTVSETIRSEILERYPVSPDRVIVAPNAAAAHFHGAPSMNDEALAAFGLRRPFLLAVGTIEPRKNLSALFEAMTFLPQWIQLAISGKAGWNAPSILGRIDELGLSGRVVRLGYVPDEVLPKLMASARTVVYPSKYEGFGLPVIEALATGSAVAASDLAVFREVGGDAVAYFDQNDSRSMASAIEAHMEDSGNEQARAERMARARAFDWQISARIVADRLREFA